MKNLLIVESPAKAKTIERYLGSSFKVKSSIGHIREIPPKDEKAIDVENGFKARYQVDPTKKKVVTELKRAVKDADQVWLATDEDREGEAIAWHLAEVLGLDVDTTKRIAFHEITKPALEEAVANPRTINMDLVHAQQARQILDRLVGYELSPVVWKKVPGGKSAGRVQSPAVRLVVEREREIAAFKPEESFKVIADLVCTSCGEGEDASVDVIDESFKAELTRTLATEAEAHTLLAALIGTHWTVGDVTTKPGSRKPPTPFTTSTLQQEANSRLGFSARATMSAAQALYQSGKITYMRTDSTELSKTALGATAHYVRDTYGEEYVHTRQYPTKNSSAQGAHEAIRPTNIALESAGKNDFEKRIYALIRNRTLASQMAAAKLEKTTVGIAATDTTGVTVADFTAKGEAITFDGFLRVYGKGGEKYLPRMSAGDELAPETVTARQTFSKAPGRFTEGSLVKKMEDLGIGRPSTYATILENIKSRGYVKIGESEGKPRDVIELRLPADAREVERDLSSEKTGSDKGRLVPNAIGEILSDFLLEHFSDIVDYGFTARTETDLDCIGHGTCDATEMLTDFYGPFHESIQAAATIDRKSVTKTREIGTDPKTGKPVSARIGRFGPMLQLGEAEDEEKPRFANLPEGSTIDTVTLDAALEMFKLPRLLGQTPDGQDVKTNIGRFGPYVQVGRTYASIKAPEDPFTITLETALELYGAKLKADAEKNIAVFDSGIKVLKGRFGPYVTDGKKNVTIPKDVDPTTVTEDQAREMIEKAPAKRKRATTKKAKAGAKKTTAKTTKKTSAS